MKNDQPFMPNIEVLFRIAQAFDGNPSMKKTRLHLASRIRWNSFVKYLDWLIQNDYVRYQLHEENYSLSDKGRTRLAKLLEIFEDMDSKRFATITPHY